MGITSNPNVRPNQIAPLVGVIDPDNYSADTYETGWVSLADFEQITAIVFAGALGSDATVNAKLEQATDGGGSGVEDVPNKAITELTEAGGDGDEQAVINLRSEEIDVNGGFTHVRLSVTIATAACDLSAAVFGFNARYAPEDDLASVVEIVN